MLNLYMYNMSVYSNDEDKGKVLDCHKPMEATGEISSCGQIGSVKETILIEQSHLPLMTT